MYVCSINEGYEEDSNDENWRHEKKYNGLIFSTLLLVYKPRKFLNIKHITGLQGVDY